LATVIIEFCPAVEELLNAANLTPSKYNFVFEAEVVFQFQII